MFSFNQGDKVYVLVAGNKVPGIVVDPTVAPRDVPVSRSRDPRGFLHLPESIIVISRRQPPGQDAFITERPEALFVVAPRAEADKGIDGKSLDDLRMEAWEGMAKLQARRQGQRQGATA
jgi:hypothetical protein